MALLDDLKVILRITTSAFDAAEIAPLIDECKEDLSGAGVVILDETDPLIQRAIKHYARANFGYADDSEKWQSKYDKLKDSLATNRNYNSFTITFTVTSADVAVPDAEITFNGETKETDAAGQAVFYYVKAGVNQEYVVSADGYVSQTVDLDVTASASVNIALVVM